MLKACPPISAASALYGCKKATFFIYLPAIILTVFFCFSSCMAQELRCVEKISPYYKEGVFTDIEHVEKIIAEHLANAPSDPEASYFMGVVCIQKSDYTSALKYFDTAIAQKGDYLKALVNRGDLYIFLKNVPAGLEDYDRAIALSPWDPALLLRRANVLMNNERFSDAITDYTTILKIFPDFAEVYNSRALAFAALNQKDNMCSDFEKLCDLGFCMNLEKAIARKDCRSNLLPKE